MNEELLMSSDEKLNEILRRLDENTERVERLQDKTDEIYDRIEKAEQITEPAIDVFESAYQKLVYGLGWLVLIVCAAVVAGVVHFFSVINVFGIFE